jgi:hypothetical protein
VIIRPHSVQRYKPLLCVSSFLAISAISLRLVRFCPFHILKGAPEGAGKYGKRTEELRIECSLDHRRVSAFGPRCLKASSGGPRFCVHRSWMVQANSVSSLSAASQSARSPPSLPPRSRYSSCARRPICSGVDNFPFALWISACNSNLD